ncbi:MAG: hypothetical protein ACI88L_000436, partial [Candidatus Paceibacteria bacterium]
NFKSHNSKSCNTACCNFKSHNSKSCNTACCNFKSHNSKSCNTTCFYSKNEKVEVKLTKYQGWNYSTPAFLRISQRLVECLKMHSI